MYYKQLSHDQNDKVSVANLRNTLFNFFKILEKNCEMEVRWV